MEHIGVVFLFYLGSIEIVNPASPIILSWFRRGENVKNLESAWGVPIQDKIFL